MTLQIMQSDIFRHFRGFAVISALLDWKLAPVGTACTNGTWIKYDPAFMEQNSRRQQLWIALHEIMHIALKHHLITHIDGKPIDHEVANRAYDYKLNADLRNCPEVRRYTDEPTCIQILIDARFNGLDERQIYRILLAEKNQQEDEKQPENDDTEENDDSGDSNDETPADDDSNDEEGNDGQPEPGSEPGNGIGGVIPADEPGDEESSASNSEPSPLADAKKIDQILQSSAMASAIAGKTGGLLEKLAGDAQKPSVNWQSATKRHVCKSVKTNRSWQQMDRRYRRIGIPYPAKTFGLPTIGVYIDASYSQSLRQINSCIAEVVQLISDFHPVIELCTFTETVQKIGTFTGSIPKLTSVARGGTDFNAVIRHFDASDCKLAIVLTDGYDTISVDTQKPMLWVWTHSDSFGSTTNSTKIKKED